MAWGLRFQLLLYLNQVLDPVSTIPTVQLQLGKPW